MMRRLGQMLLSIWGRLPAINWKNLRQAIASRLFARVSGKARHVRYFQLWSRL